MPKTRNGTRRTQAVLNSLTNADNWIPSTAVPTGIATFGPAVNEGSIPQTTEDTSFGEITFLSNAPSYDFLISPGNLTLSAAGIINPNSTEQIFVVEHDSILSFISGSSAGNNNAIRISNRGGAISFFDTSTAGSATFENQSGGSMIFAGNSTAGNAVIVNDVGAGTITFAGSSNAGTAAISNGSTDGPGSIIFIGTSNGGNAVITNFQSNSLISFEDMSNAGAATITNDSGGRLDFNNSSTAGSATITNSSTMSFNDTSSAGSATITNNLFLNFFDGSTAGTATINNNANSVVSFFGDTNAGSASIINNGTLVFDGNSTASNAAITNASSRAVTDFSLSTGPTGDNKLSAGSIAGAGLFQLGANELTVGGNDMSTDVSGAILGTGSLVKVGTGTLTLSGHASLGGATIDGGTLAVNGGTLNASDTIVVGSTGGSSGTLNIGAGGSASAVNLISRSKRGWNARSPKRRDLDRFQRVHWPVTGLAGYGDRVGRKLHVDEQLRPSWSAAWVRAR